MEGNAVIYYKKEPGSMGIDSRIKIEMSMDEAHSLYKEIDNLALEDKFMLHEIHEEIKNTLSLSLVIIEEVTGEYVTEDQETYPGVA